jgi:hypothetical protein
LYLLVGLPAPRPGKSGRARKTWGVDALLALTPAREPEVARGDRQDRFKCGKKMRRFLASRTEGNERAKRRCLVLQS